MFKRHISVINITITQWAVFNKKVGITLFGTKGLINAECTDHPGHLKLTKSLQSDPLQAHSKTQIDPLRHITNSMVHIRDSIRYIVGGLNLQLVYSAFNINIHLLHSSINQSTKSIDRSHTRPHPRTHARTHARARTHTHTHTHTHILTAILPSHRLPIPLLRLPPSSHPLTLPVYYTRTHAHSRPHACILKVHAMLYVFIRDNCYTTEGNQNCILPALFRDVMIPRWQHTIP